MQQIEFTNRQKEGASSADRPFARRPLGAHQPQPFNQPIMHLQMIDGRLPIHVETVNLKLRDQFKEALLGKAGSLFRRHSHLLGVKLRVRREEKGKAPSRYSATVQLVLPGYDRIVVKKGEKLSSLLSETLEVAGRQLRRRARALRAKKRS